LFIHKSDGVEALPGAVESFLSRPRIGTLSRNLQATANSPKALMPRRKNKSRFAIAESIPRMVCTQSKQVICCNDFGETIRRLR